MFIIYTCNNIKKKHFKIFKILNILILSVLDELHLFFHALFYFYYLVFYSGRVPQAT